MSALEGALHGALALGCLLWIVRAGLGIRIRRAVPLAARLPAADGPMPALSVVVAARDERDTLEAAAATLLAQELPGLELVLVDDRSEDGTGELVDRLAATDGRVRPLHVTELPGGWLGKVHAMECGRRAAGGDWLLFTDADVHFAEGVLRRIVAWAEREGVDHVAVLPSLASGGFLLDAAVANFAWALSAVQRVWAVSDPTSEAYVGIGAFNLVRRSALERAAGEDGLAWLKLEVAEDLGLGLMLKRSGARSAVLGGRDAVSVRWYASLRAMAVGLEKNLFAVAGRCSLARIAPRALVVALLELVPFAALFGPPWLAACGLAALVLGSLGAVAGAAWMGHPRFPALFHPIGGVLLGAFWLRAGWLGWRRGGIYWRGTFYSSERLREGLRVFLP